MIKIERLGVKILEDKRNNNEEEYITINLDGSDVVEENTEKASGKRSSRRASGKRTTRIGNNKKEGKGKIKWSKKKIGITIAIVVAVLIVIIGIAFGRYVYKAEGDVKKAVLNMASDVAVNIVGNDEPIFVLVLGISEDITSKLTDTIMLGGYNPESQKAFLVSIPRDTFVGTNEATASGWDKINALYQKDITKTIKAVEERTGINIDNYVVVRNTMLPALVNAIGEVEFNVPIDMDYDDPTQDLHIHLKAGTQMINGDEAEQLLRFRHNNDGSSYPSSYGDNDYGRMKTQREFIKVVANHLIKINNVGTLKSIAEALFANLETNMSIGDMIGYIPYAINFNVDDIRMEQLPGSGAMLNKLSFYKASYSRSKALMDELIEYLALDESETKKYYTGKIKQTVAATAEEEKQDECAHNYSSEIIKTSTCEETGIRKYTCSLCGGTYEETIATASHNYNSNGVCTVCGGEKEPEKHTCNYTKFIHEELPATCINNGEATYRCEKCTSTINKTIPATGKHTYGADGKCTTTGCTAQKEVSNNNNSGTQTGSDANKPSTPTEQDKQPTTHTHSYVGSITTQPTCGTKGVKTYTCSCGEGTYIENIPATGNHTPGTPVTTNPTCGAAGSTVTKCTVCSTTISTTPIAATGAHTYVNGSCSVCGAADPNYTPPATDTTTPPADVTTGTTDTTTSQPAA